MAGAIPKQTQEDIVPPPPIALGYRLGGVLLAAPVAATLQVVLEGPVGLDLVVPDLGSSTLEPLPLLLTVAFTLGMSLLAWITVAVAERALGAERGRTAWAWAAFAVFVLSLIPVYTMGATAGQTWGLVALHAVVALLLIPSMTAKGTPGVHGPTNLGEPASAGDVGGDHHGHDAHGHDAHAHDDHAGHGHDAPGPDHADDAYAHAAPASDAHDDSAHDDALDH